LYRPARGKHVHGPTLPRADDGIRTRDPHLGNETGTVHRRSLKFILVGQKQRGLPKSLSSPIPISGSPLEADLESGRWAKRFDHLLRLEELDKGQASCCDGAHLGGTVTGRPPEVDALAGRHEGYKRACGGRRVLDDGSRCPGRETSPRNGQSSICPEEELTIAPVIARASSEARNEIRFDVSTTEGNRRRSAFEAMISAIFSFGTPIAFPPIS